MYVGRALSINASISVALVDARAAEAISGDDDELADELAGLEAAIRSFELGGASALGLNLGAGQGIVHAFGVADRIVLVETFADVRDPRLLAFVALPPSGPADRDRLTIASAAIAVLVPGGSYVPKGPRLVIPAKPGRYRVHLEPVLEHAFGASARAVLITT